MSRYQNIILSFIAFSLLISKLHGIYSLFYNNHILCRLVIISTNIDIGLADFVEFEGEVPDPDPAIFTKDIHDNESEKYAN
jgi:hypothetical protein